MAPISANLLDRRVTHFVLWRPNGESNVPTLVLGKAKPNSTQLDGERSIPMAPVAGVTGLWEVAANACGLAAGDIIHYWFEVEDTHPHRRSSGKVRCTDPAAHTVDWRLAQDWVQATAVVRFDGTSLTVCDSGGETPDFSDDRPSDELAPNHRLVIYELPTAWTRTPEEGAKERAVGTFRDVRALLDETVAGANFEGSAVVRKGHSYLSELGVNALELLPPADSASVRDWGYDTTHYLAPDYDLGKPEANTTSTANADLAALVVAAHRDQIRFFIDAVMAFGNNEPYSTIDFDDFCIEDPGTHRDDPDALSSRGSVRDGFGSTLFRYTRGTDDPVYDPIEGTDKKIVPARQHMLIYLTRWMRDFRVDGIRMDSVENVANWDFVRDFKDRARDLWNERWTAQGLGAGADERFIVVGEELTVPQALLTQQRLDGLWNDTFRDLIRAALIGQNFGERTFEDTVRQAIDCRSLGFTDGAQAVNYLTSHDVEGFRRERLFNFFNNSSVIDVERRAKLAFSCLLTAVGIPMILAGEEFADQHDLFDEHGNVSQQGGKQVDPVDFSRLQDDWRQRLFQHVSRLVKLRTTSDALSVNDTDFIHTDFNGKRVLVWKRGNNNQTPVIVVANFSDFSSDGGLNGEYRVPNWPETPANKQWREVTQDRVVPADRIRREPIFHWEAKVYTLE